MKQDSLLFPHNNSQWLVREGGSPLFFAFFVELLNEKISPNPYGWNRKGHNSFM